jgi:hypothetical protein
MVEETVSVSNDSAPLQSMNGLQQTVEMQKDGGRNKFS